MFQHITIEVRKERAIGISEVNMGNIVSYQFFSLSCNQLP